MLDQENRAVEVVSDKDERRSSTVELVGPALTAQALDLIVAILAELIEGSPVDADDFADDLDRVSQIADHLR